MFFNIISGVVTELTTDVTTGQRYPDSHRVRITINSDNLEQEVWVPFMSPSQLTVDRIMIAIEKVIQSNRNWMFEAPMDIGFVHAPLPDGGLSLTKFSGRLEEFLKAKKSIIRVTEAPLNTCCARAILLSKMHRDQDTRELRRAQNKPRRLERPVTALHRNAGIPIGVMCGAPEWTRFQDALGLEYDLVVLSREYFNSIIFRGNPQASKIIAIYHAERHFHAITTLSGFLGSSYLCKGCLKGYQVQGEHM